MNFENDKLTNELVSNFIQLSKNDCSMLKALQTELDETESRVEELEKQNEKLKTDLDDTENKNEELKKMIEVLELRNDYLSNLMCKEDGVLTKSECRRKILLEQEVKHLTEDLTNYVRIYHDLKRQFVSLVNKD